ncbi:MAG: S8/S53 family peptidase [Patescibacteria group bacterium]
MQLFRYFNRPKPENEQIQIEKFADLCGLDLSKITISSKTAKELVITNFDTQTKWPPVDKLPTHLNPEKFLEESKNPGLGIKELHEQGITGQGVIVATIDQKLDTNHPEYEQTIKSYDEYGKTKREPISMHGPAVASLLVGQNCGVAPGAKLVYKAVPSGSRNFLPWAQALKDIIEKNKNLKPENKVKVVSCSIGYMTENPEPGLNEWIDALEKAKEEGIFVVDVEGDQVDIPFSGGGSPKNKNDFGSYLSWLGNNEGNDKLIVPSDYRTMASSWNKKGQYMYNGRGGLSWSVPYLAGLFALILQVNPNIKREEIAEITNESAVVNKKGLKIINPKGIIDLVKERIKN